IDQLVGFGELHREEARFAARHVEAIGVKQRRVCPALSNRPTQGTKALEQLIGYPGEQRGAARDLPHDVARRLVAPVLTELSRKLRQYLPSRKGFTQRRHRLIEPLNASLRVHERAFLLE